MYDKKDSGFEAQAFVSQCSNEIVISFAGTSPSSGADWIANSTLASGVPGVDQLLQAAEFYLTVKAANPGANITITGHSLGGGLASLIGALFNCSATTFDQAPFGYSLNTDSVTVLLEQLIATHKYSLMDLAPLQQYANAFTNTSTIGGALGGGLGTLGGLLVPIPGISTALSTLTASVASIIGGNKLDNSLALARAANVLNLSVQGEALQYLPFPRIGAEATPLTHGDYANPIDLHDQALLTTFVQSGAFREMTNRLPELLGMVFDGNLFYYSKGLDNPDKVSFLENLIRHQAGGIGGIPAGGDTMLDRFTTDLDALATAGVNQTYRDLGKALIAFAMEKYYSEDPAIDPNAQQQLFEAVTGGLQFDTTRINATITDAKGYAQYFTNYLDNTLFFTAQESALIRSKIATLHDWSIAVGESGMTATDSKNNGAFMLGEAGRDTLTGGTGNDLLVGGRGSDKLDGGDGTDTLIGGKDGDTLTGGLGSDTLYGGQGTDTYIHANGDGADTIIDYKNDGYGGDGSGSIKYGDAGLSGGIGGDDSGQVKKADKGGTFKSTDSGKKYTYVWGGPGTDLTITSTDDADGSVTVKKFENGTMGITLYSRKKDDTSPDGGGGSGGIGGGVDSGVGGAAIARQTFGDPLTLDLNGNGIETVPLKQPPLLFDINGNGIKVGAGWIAPSDGLLAMDRNGNGMIDSGTELFGDATPKYAAGTTTPAGTARTADGFAALAQEDTNGDGVVNNLDANWANLKVWQDLNQDGISQSNELKTMDEAGIASFNVGRTTYSKMLPSGNQMADLGTFTRTDGTTGNTGAPQAMADINLALDTFHRTFTDTIPTTAQTEALPNMQGSGKVRDMREAASLQTTAGQAMATALTNFSSAATREEQLAQLDTLLAAWADTAEFGSLKSRAAEHGYSVNTNLDAVWQRRLSTLEAFVGHGFFKMPWDGASIVQTGLQGLSFGRGTYDPVIQRYVWDPKVVNANFWSAQMVPLSQAYDALRESVYQALLPQTRLKPYLDAVIYTVDANGLHLDFSAVQAAFQTQATLNPDKAIADLIEFNRYGKDTFARAAWQAQGGEMLDAANDGVFEIRRGTYGF